MASRRGRDACANRRIAASTHKLWVLATRDGTYTLSAPVPPTCAGDLLLKEVEMERSAFHLCSYLRQRDHPKPHFVRDVCSVQAIKGVLASVWQHCGVGLCHGLVQQHATSSSLTRGSKQRPPREVVSVCQRSNATLAGQHDNGTARIRLVLWAT